MNNYDLSEFAKQQLEKVSEISEWSYYLSSYDALEFVQKARRYRKNSKDEPFHFVPCLNEETKQIEYVGITYRNTLKEFIIILLCESHHLSKQKTKKFIEDHRNESKKH